MPDLHIAVVGQNVVRRDGQGRVMVELCRVLLERGHRLEIHAHRVDEALAAHPQVSSVPLSLAPGPQIVDDVAIIARSWWRMRRSDADVVLSLGPSVAAAGPPIVYNAQFSQQGWRAAWTPTTRPRLVHRLHTHAAAVLERLCARRADHLIVSTGPLGVEIAGDSLTTPMTVVPNGVDLDEFAPPTEAEAKTARHELGLDPEATIVGFLGEFQTTRKGLDPLLVALAAPGRDLHLVVAAPGPRDELAARVEALGIGSRVTIAGFEPPPKVIAAADIMVVASSYEPFSLVALESCAMGVPVALSAVAGVAPLLGEGVVLVDRPHDPIALGAALDVLSDPDERARRRQAGLEAAQRLSWTETMTGAAEAIELVAAPGATS